MPFKGVHILVAPKEVRMPFKAEVETNKCVFPVLRSSGAVKAKQSCQSQA